MIVLLLNAGSSSLKAAAFDIESGQLLVNALAEWAAGVMRYSCTIAADQRTRNAENDLPGHTNALQRILHDLQSHVVTSERLLNEELIVTHRIVHGGQYHEAKEITSEVKQHIADLAELAPLHNRVGLEVIEAAEQCLPNARHVAVFDTAFHATLLPESRHYPLPSRWRKDWAIQRYGFHGLSHAYCSHRAAEMLGQPIASLNTIVCHLGHGCSAAAIRRGKCIDTTMGFTPLDGLMMATRSGAVDPGVILYVQKRYGLSPTDVDQALNSQSGLLGVSEVSADMRQVLNAAESGHEPSRLAIDLYAHRVRQSIGALAVTLGRVDVLVFTAGVGEHSAETRRLVCRGLEVIGVHIDHQKNLAATPDMSIAEVNSPVSVLVVHTREEQSMLRETLTLLQRDRVV